MAAAAEQQRRQAQMRLHQGGGGGLPPGAAGQLAQLGGGAGPYGQQMAGPGAMHPQLQQLQQFQQQNPGIRIPPQQVLQGQHLIPPQAMPGPGMQHVQVQQAGQPVVNGRYQPLVPVGVGLLTGNQTFAVIPVCTVCLGIE